MTNLAHLRALPIARCGRRTLMAGSGGLIVRDRSEGLLSKAHGRRCRIQGLKDAQLFHGWFASFNDGLLQFDSKSQRRPVVGDLVYVEVDTLGFVLRFACLVVSGSGSILNLKAHSDIEQRPQTKEPRVRIDQLPGRLTIAKADIELIVVDGSDNGFGFLAHTPIAHGQCQCLVQSPHGEISMAVDIRHTRNLAEQGCLRGGARVLSMDRVARARWTRVLTDVMEAA